jgi:hypothetical protein
MIAFSWKYVLRKRDTKNMIEIPVNTLSSDCEKALNELMKERYIVLLDTGVISSLGKFRVYNLFYKIYLLTSKGVKLCEDHEIRQRKNT